MTDPTLHICHTVVHQYGLFAGHGILGCVAHCVAKYTLYLAASAAIGVAVVKSCKAMAGRAVPTLLAASLLLFPTLGA